MRRTRSGLYVADGIRLPGPPMAGGAPVRVQFVGAVGTGNVASLPVTLASTAAGNLLTAVVQCGGSGDPVAAPANWVKRIGPITTEATATTLLYLFDFIANPGGVTSVTFANSGTANGMVAGVWEFSGANTLDQTANNPNQATAPIHSGTTAGLASTSDLAVVGLATHAGVANTWSGITAGYTAEAQQATGGGATNNPALQPCYQALASNTATSCSGTPSAQNGGAGVIATYYAGAPPAAIPVSVGQAKMTPQRV